MSEEDLVAITKHNTPHKTSIPLDLTLEIFSRLPAKSISRFCCVSKLWSTIPRLPYFTELVLTRSLARPLLLFASEKDKHMFLYSSTQPDDNNSSRVAAKYHMKYPYHGHVSLFGRCSFVRGLVFTRGEVWVISNPNTGQSVTLPKLNTGKMNGVIGYFGYDPIEKQYKVLSMTWEINGLQNTEEHQVLTLGTGSKHSWRRIECCIPHSIYRKYNHVCIDGVLYYPAVNMTTRRCIIVLFDVRSEKFRFVEDNDPLASYYSSPMINYNGKLGLLLYERDDGIHGSCTSFRLRVLEDADQREWSEHD
ncbi:F-box protein DOR [Capsella rubella]|nr:F-box protein DOR [Capsella rubella]